MGFKITKRVTKNATRVIVEMDDNDQLVYIKNYRRNNYETIGLGFICEGTRHYQHLMWQCRAGKKSYYKALIALYRYLFKHRLTDKSLQKLASGEKWARNSGLAIRKTPAAA